MPYLHKSKDMFLDNSYLHRVSPQSRLAVNDKADNEMKPGAVRRDPGIYLTIEENLTR